MKNRWFLTQLACCLKRSRLYAGGLALALSPVAAQALPEVCTVTTTGVTFSNYSFTNPAPSDSAGNVQVSCTLLLGLVGVNVSYQILLSQGGSSSYAPRRMSHVLNSLQYNLYSDVGYSTVWGDGTAGTSTISDTYSLPLLGTIVRNYPVYGRIPAGQNTLAGIYADILTVTVNY